MSNDENRDTSFIGTLLDQLTTLRTQYRALEVGYSILETEVGHLRAALGATRRAYANLVAAGRAAILADRDGEPDPWGYLRDELPPPPDGHPLTDLPGGDTSDRFEHGGGWCR